MDGIRRCFPAASSSEPLAYPTFFSNRFVRDAAGLMRPLGGTTGMFVELISHFGPDHFVTRTAATIIGSTETTLYVLAVYFGSVAIRRTRHAVAAGLLADAAGIVASVVVCRLVFG